MSTRIDNKVKCDCGHEGVIHLHESDGPINNMWESYSLENLNGQSLDSDSPVKMDMVLKQMNVTCPNCKEKIKLSNLGWT